MDSNWSKPRLARTPAARRISLPLAPSLERQRVRAYLGLLLIDGLAIVAGFALTGWIYFGSANDGDGLLAAQLLLPFYWTAALSLRVYSMPALLSASFAQARSLLAMVIAAMVILFVAFFTKSSEDFSRFVLVAGTAASSLLIAYGKWALRPLINRHFGNTAVNLLVIDDRGQPIRVNHAFHIDAAEHELVPDLNDPHMLDRIGLYMMNMDRVVVSCPPERRGQWALVFKSANIQGEIIDREVWELGVLGARRDDDFGSLIVSGGPLGMRSRVLKRAFDVAFAASVLVALAPLLALVALMILIEDGRPVLFVQPRTGRGNRFFAIYKFRSMRHESSDHAGARSTSRGDSRITRVGKWIRRTSIDELPQLLNVLRGDMSIVGPRPHAVGSRAGEKLFWEVDSRYWLRHSLKPGLTGLAQIRGWRGATEDESDLAHRLQADLEYITGWTIWRDLRIILSTLGVMTHRQAY